MDMAADGNAVTGRREGASNRTGGTMLRALLIVTLLPCGISLAGEPPAPPPRKAVVVELFTSEGCSSCPPAEQQLANAAKNQPFDGIEIIPLAWHVDYFNDPWVDAFSSRQWTARQSEYVGRFGLPSNYTPQMVVDGTREFVGGERKSFQEAVARAGEGQKGSVQLTAAPADEGKSIRVSVRASTLPKLSANDSAEVFVVVTEDGLRVAIKRGENGGSTLRHSGVVRFARQIGQVDAKSPDRFTGDTTITLDASWKVGHLNAVVLVQEHRTGRIVVAASVPLPGSP
jgi:hypothetical protein